MGQLGDGSTTDNSTPVVVAGGATFSAIAAGQYQTCALTSSGAAYCWGGNSSGQLGRGVFNYSTVPVKVAGQP
jgi:alpha-tubulin suppressor-like RCC1 family protein